MQSQIFIVVAKLFILGNNIISCRKTHLTFYFVSVSGCQFYPPGEYLRFVRVPENLKVGEEVLKIDVHPRRNLNLQAVDKVIC